MTPDTFNKGLIPVRVVNSITTTESKGVVALAYQMPRHTSALITIKALGVDVNQNTIAFESRCVVKRAIANCVIVGLPVIIFNSADENLACAFVVPSAEGKTISIGVEGIEGVLISWALSMDISYLTKST